MLRKWIKTAKAAVGKEEDERKPEAGRCNHSSDSEESAEEDEVPECSPEPKTKAKGKSKVAAGMQARSRDSPASAKKKADAGPVERQSSIRKEEGPTLSPLVRGG
jgi:hypothetical protein